MTKLQSTLRFLLLSVWSVIMTALTYILGAASLKMMRRKLGSGGYWALSSAMSLGLFLAGFKMLALAYFSLVVLMGVLSEMEELGFGLRVSVFFTLVINCLLAAGAFTFWVYSTGSRWSQILVGQIESLLKPLAQLNPQVQINYQDVVMILPSFILILWLGAIYLAIILESRMNPGSTAEGQSNMRDQLHDLRLPDACVWLLILSLLGAFGGFAGPVVETASANVLNVCSMLFFFQGMGVVHRYFESMRVSPLWQKLLVVLIVLYLFLFVSVLGLVDYWVDFRSRISKRSSKEEVNRET